MKDMIYQSFILDGSRQERADKSRSEATSFGERGEKLIALLKERFPVILVSSLVFAGVYATIIVGADIGGAKDIKTDFARITEKLELIFVSGPFFTQIT